MRQLATPSPPFQNASSSVFPLSPVAIHRGSGGEFGVRRPALFHVTAVCRTRQDSFSSLIILTFAASAVTNPPPARRSLPRTAAAGINDGIGLIWHFSNFSHRALLLSLHFDFSGHKLHNGLSLCRYCGFFFFVFLFKKKPKKTC